MPRYFITEPHPTVAQNAYTHSGRGGAGNTFRAPKTTPAAGVPTVVAATPKPAKSSSSSSSTRFYSGRGGAGNAHAAANRVQLSFDDEYSAAAARDQVRAGCHVGRGGAGNVWGSAGSSSSSSSKSEASRRDSSSTEGSVRSGFWGRLSTVASR